MTAPGHFIVALRAPWPSAAYGFVRFIGGGLAPYVAGKIAEHYNIHVPFLLGALAMLLAIVVLSTGHRLRADAERASRTGIVVAPDDGVAAVGTEREPEVLAPA